MRPERASGDEDEGPSTVYSCEEASGTARGEGVVAVNYTCCALREAQKCWP
uniref:Uncharacterized protein n=1 Tax=Arundo donax TaxID=35708 RepID=A0A0A9ADX3_ARUDO